MAAKFRRMRGQVDVWHGGWPSSNYGWRLGVAGAASIILLGVVACLLSVAGYVIGSLTG
jgi:hypothetical protein